MPLVSIIICTYNGAKNLPQTLASLGEVHVPPGFSAELLIVDNGSYDGTLDIAKAFELPNMVIRHIAEPRHGKSYAYNTGLQAAQGEIFLCTDDDVRFPLNWIEGMCAPICSGQAHSVAGGIKLAKYLERPWMESFHRGKLGSTENLNGSSPGAMYGANMAFARSILVRLTGFDTELGPAGLGTHEETLFSLQVQAGGYTLASAFDVAVEHWADASILQRSAYLDRARKSGRSRAYIAHHWEHKTIAHPYKRLAFYRFYLNYLRLKKGREWLTWRLRPEGCPGWEIALVETIYFYKQYLIERRRPRNYHRHGLVKLNHC
jgi:glycosyltransferase involved in cell wall biosynthesis